MRLTERLHVLLPRMHRVTARLKSSKNPDDIAGPKVFETMFAHSHHHRYVDKSKFKFANLTRWRQNLPIFSFGFSSVGHHG